MSEDVQCDTHATLFDSSVSDDPEGVTGAWQSHHFAALKS